MIQQWLKTLSKDGFIMFLLLARCHPLFWNILYVCLFQNALFKVAYHKQTDIVFFLLISALESGSMLNTFSRFLNLSPSCVSVTVTPEFIVNTQRRRIQKQIRINSRTRIAVLIQFFTHWIHSLKLQKCTHLTFNTVLWKTKRFTLTEKIFRQINYIYIYWFHGNFFKKVWE